ncbi:MAG: hypothetical protein GTN75_03825, partial [Gemmatimonadetes bacterium]|nr:hypothetical protein [Gemmatimonadota bacterium]
MRQSVSKIGQLLLLGGAAPAVLVLLLWSGGGGGQTARAYPGLTVGIDLYPNNSDPDLDGVYSSVDVTKFESCYAISGPGNSIDVDVFVLDVADLAAFSADVEYDSSVIDVTGVDTDLLLGSAPGSIVVDVSGPIPPSPPGKYEAGAFDQEQKGVDGS